MWGSDFALSGRLLHFVLPRALPWAGWLLPLRGAGGMGAITGRCLFEAFAWRCGGGYTPHTALRLCGVIRIMPLRGMDAVIEDSHFSIN